MPKLKYRNDEEALRRLANAERAIDEYSSAHKGKLTETERREFGSLLNERAAALSQATGMRIHSLAEED